MPLEKTSRSPCVANCRGMNRSRARKKERRGKSANDVFAASRGGAPGAPGEGEGAGGKGLARPRGGGGGGGAPRARRGRGGPRRGAGGGRARPGSRRGGPPRPTRPR